MELLKTIFFGTLYIAGILLLISIIIAIVQVTIDSIKNRNNVAEKEEE